MSAIVIKPQSGTRKSVVPWAILAAFAICWLSFFLLMSPAPGGPDVFVFRDAGCNLARGTGLVAASVPHANTLIPRLFASYTPGAVLLFALPASMFGCSAPVDTFYNLAFAACASFLLYYCFHLAVRSGWQRACAAVLLGAMLPTGMVAFDPDRPEMPAFCLLTVIVLLWTRTSTVPVRAGLFAGTGLLFLIHPFAAIAGWLLLVFLITFSQRTGENNSWKRCLLTVGVGTALAAVPVAAWAVSMWSVDHTALHRFLEHAAGKGTGAGVVLHSPTADHADSKLGAHNGYAVAFRQLFDPAFPAAAALAASLLVTGLLISAAALRGPNKQRLLLQCSLLLAILLLFPVIVFPAQTNYLSLSRAILLTLVFTGNFLLARRLRGTPVPLMLLLIAFFFSAPWVGLQVLQTAEARTSYLREQEQAKRVRAYFTQRGLQDPALVVDAGHYFVYKPYFANLYNPNYLEPGDATDYLQGIVACYAGSRAFTRADLPANTALGAGKWTLIDSGEDVVRVTVFGHPVMRRNWTWMCDVYARR